MRDPVCKYPRKPTGPSGFGESGVRRLQQFGGDYQRNRPDANTLSIQSGDFSKVIIDGVPEYVSTGRQASKTIVRDTMDFRRKFSKSLASKSIPGSLAVGSNGLYIAREVMGFDDAFLAYSYEIYPGQSQSVNFDREQIDMRILYGGYLVGQRPVTDYSIYYMFMSLTPGNTIYLKNGDEVSYWGKHPTKGRCCVSLSIGNLGRADPANGRPLATLTLIRHTEVKVPGELIEEYPLDPGTFTRENAEFMWLTEQVVLKDYTVCVFAETFFRPGVATIGGDYRPKFWAVATPNNDQFGTLTYSDLTASAFPDGRIPDPTPTPVNHYTTTAGRAYQFDLSATMFTMKIAAVANDAFVMTWQQRMPGGWRSRVARVSVSGGSVTATLVHETSDQASRTTLEYWQSVVHLGNGVVLAKITSGVPGTNYDVTFRLSTDSGASWGSPFEPSGFAAPLKNEYFGNFRAHTATTPEATGRVLIPAWDASESAYYVWSSDNHGASWERKAKIFKPTSFLRVDTMDAADGGGNFDDLVPGPVFSKELDVTLPDRYKDRS